jgi:acetolactate synthase small subunit
MIISIEKRGKSLLAASANRSMEMFQERWEMVQHCRGKIIDVDLSTVVLETQKKGLKYSVSLTIRTLSITLSANVGHKCLMSRECRKLLD